MIVFISYKILYFNASIWNHGYNLYIGEETKDSLGSQIFTFFKIAFTALYFSISVFFKTET